MIACDAKGAEPMSQSRPANGVDDIAEEGRKPEGLAMPEAGDADHEFVSQRLDEFKRAAGDPELLKSLCDAYQLDRLRS